MNHDHEHDHAPANFNRAFAFGIALNIGFVAIEAFYGWKVDSLALLADAGHNLSDVVGLVLAWGGALAIGVRPNVHHTYGWKRAGLLAALFNALLLLLAMGMLAWEAVTRLAQPSPVSGMTLIAVAGVGVVINTATALLFLRGGEQDLNIRGAFLHMAADALVSVSVVIGGVLALWKGWNWIDPVMSLVIVVVILVGTWGLFRQSIYLLMDGVPNAIDPRAIYAYLASLPEVRQVHDLHIWALSTSQNALTAHLVMTTVPADDAFLQEIVKTLDDRFDIDHATLQVEHAPCCNPCENPFVTAEK